MHLSQLIAVLKKAPRRWRVHCKVLANDGKRSNKYLAGLQLSKNNSMKSKRKEWNEGISEKAEEDNR